VFKEISPLQENTGLGQFFFCVGQSVVSWCQISNDDLAFAKIIANFFFKYLYQLNPQKRKKFSLRWPSPR